MFGIFTKICYTDCDVRIGTLYQIKNSTVFSRSMSDHSNPSIFPRRSHRTKVFTNAGLCDIIKYRALEFGEANIMKNGVRPDPNIVHPINGYDKEIYIKPTIKNPNIIVGDFSYIADSEFESHVTYHYEWNGDKLIIGKFCQIATGVEFIMNGANHQMNAVSTFPFYTLEGWDMEPPEIIALPIKGDTVIGNDVWIGQHAVILPGIHIGDGAIIGADSVVGSDVEPYTIVVGNPAKVLRKRFDDELIGLLLSFKWWDKSIDEINALIPLLTCSDLNRVKEELKKAMIIRTNSDLAY